MTPSERTAALIDAFNVGDLDRFRELAGDAVYHEPATGRTLQGDEYIQAVEGWRAAFPDIRGEITAQVEGAGMEVSEITWTGTHSGPLLTPAGELPPTGNSMTNPASMVSHYEGEQLARINHYFDMLTVLRAAGAA